MLVHMHICMHMHMHISVHMHNMAASSCLLVCQQQPLQQLVSMYITAGASCSNLAAHGHGLCGPTYQSSCCCDGCPLQAGAAVELIAGGVDRMLVSKYGG